jgi:CheY-like chemotaxis protein
VETKFINQKFIIIDDDPINNHICTKYLQIVFPKADIKTFTIPQKGLDDIFLEYSEKHVSETILFLDINMPVLSGWDVLDRFTLFPEALKKQFTIYILSSSVAHEDRKKADDNILVSGFLEKPLSIMQLEHIKRQLL